MGCFSVHSDGLRILPAFSCLPPALSLGSDTSVLCVISTKYVLPPSISVIEIMMKSIVLALS